MARQRVPRTRAGGTWTKARYFGFIRSALRNAYSRYPPKFQAKEAARRKKKAGKRFEYQCAVCNKWFPNSETEVDHIEPAGSLRSYDDLPAFVEKLFCEPDGLQVVCKVCHQRKTNDENAKRKAARASSSTDS